MVNVLKTKIVSSLLDNQYINEWDLNLFHSTEWRRTVSNGFSGGWKFIIVSKDNVELVVLPVFIKKVFLSFFIGSPLRGSFSLYTGPFVRKNINSDLRALAFRAIFNFVRDLDSELIEIVVESSFDGLGEMVEAAKEQGFAISMVPSLELDLSTGVETVWKNLQGRARTAIRKAEKNDIIIEFKALEASQIPLIYSMLERTFETQNAVVPHKLDAFIAFESNLIRDKQYFYVEAKHDGQIVSFGIFVIDRERVIFHTAASSEIGYKFGASSYLMWKSICFSIESKFKKFDFGGTGLESIDKFKSSFSGLPINHIRFSRFGFFGYFFDQLILRNIWKKHLLKFMRKYEII